MVVSPDGMGRPGLLTEWCSCPLSNEFAGTLDGVDPRLTTWRVWLPDVLLRGAAQVDVCNPGSVRGYSTFASNWTMAPVTPRAAAIELA